MADPLIEDTWAVLRRHTTGDLRFDEHLRPIRYVIMSDGRLVAAVMVAMLQAVDTMLFIPECAEGAMEAMVTLEQFTERGPAGPRGPGAAAADRWRIYHGEPEDVHWAWVNIDAAKYAGAVIDGAALTRPNPLAEAEPRLCREINQDAESLKQICRAAGIDVERPVAVGVDPLGIDVRRRFDVARLEAPEPMNTAEEAKRVLATMHERSASRRG